jgi:hypothetical protein
MPPSECTLRGLEAVLHTQAARTAGRVRWNLCYDYHSHLCSKRHLFHDISCVFLTSGEA